MSLTRRIATAHLLGRKRQTFVSLMGVALGVGAFVALAALMQGFQRYFVEKTIDVSPHIVMKDEYRAPPRQPAEIIHHDGAVAIRGVKPREELRGIKDARAVMTALADIPGATVAPTLRGQVFMRYGSTDVSSTLSGIDPPRERLVTKLETDLTEGSLDDLQITANAVILGVGLAAKLGARIGDTLTVTSPAGIVLKMKVTGLFSTGITSIDNNDSYALLKKAQVLHNRPNVVNQLRLRLDDIQRAAPLSAEIEARYGYRTESWEETNKNVLSVFVIQNGIIYSTTGALLLVAAFGIFNIISTIVMEKRRDIAILKSIGVDERDIRRVFLLEGLTVGIAGSLAGWGVGYALTFGLSQVRFKVEGFVRSEGFTLYWGFDNYVIALAFATAAATFAGYLPARRAAAVDPVEIIRGAG